MVDGSHHFSSTFTFFQKKMKHSDLPIPGEKLLHPWPLLALLLIAFNDYFLKIHWRGWLSGKLSDIGICFLLPIFLVAVVEWGMWLWFFLLRRRGWGPASRRIHLTALFVTGVYFSALQLSPLWISLHKRLISFFLNHHFVSVTPDRSDLWALLMLPISFWYLQRS